MAKFDGVMLACDMDGTLINSEFKVSRENTEAVRYFTDNGGSFTIATGRMISAITMYTQQVSINAPIIALNGAVIYDMMQDKLLHSTPLGADILEIVDGLRNHFTELGIEVFMPDKMYICQGSYITRLHCEIINVPYIFTDIRMINGVCIKLNLTQKPDYLFKVEQYFNTHYPNAFYLVYSNPHYLEVLNINANKGWGLNTVADILHISHEHVYAIGDSYNDIEMLNKAGFSFAPANAELPVKEAADILVSSNDEHAVQQVIEYLDRCYE